MGGSCEIEWVNHASFILRRNEVNLLCDPWLEGTAFKDGWQLISPTAFTYGDFAGIKDIWFSHQHPDHFAPTNLRNIDPEVRKRATVLYQHRRDKLAVNWCKSAGFGKVIELPLLNVNDCVLKRSERINDVAALVGHMDVLFTQFSYAQWIDLAQKLAAGPTHFGRTPRAQEFESQVGSLLGRLRKKNKRAVHLIREHITVFLTDLKRAYELSSSGMAPVTLSENDVSGRFTSAHDGHLRFFAFMRKLHHYNVTRVDLTWFLQEAKRVAATIRRRSLRILTPRLRRTA